MPGTLVDASSSIYDGCLLFPVLGRRGRIVAQRHVWQTAMDAYVMAGMRISSLFTGHIRPSPEPKLNAGCGISMPQPFLLK
jgi:hypothetical protein